VLSAFRTMIRSVACADGISSMDGEVGWLILLPFSSLPGGWRPGSEQQESYQ
jgi:hypothetical protein